MSTIGIREGARLSIFAHPDFPSPSTLPGISIGSYLAARVSDRFLLPVLASILVLIGLRLITS
jgi:uncharacterized membrane protein YfcA